MCLFPGMLEPSPSYVSKHALKLCSILNWLFAALFVVALARVLALAVWATIMDVFVCVFGYCMLKPLREKNALVFIENFVGMSFVTFTNGVISVLTLVDLATGKQVLFDRLQSWQVIVGYCTHSAAILCYFVITATVVLLIRELGMCRVPIDEETAPLISRPQSLSSGGQVSRGAVAPKQQSFTQGSQVLYSGGTHIPPARQASTAAEREKTDSEKFPGKGYSLK